MSKVTFGWGACVKHAPQRRFRGPRGAVTAEAAVVIPLIAVFALGCVWLLSLAVAQVRVTDAAREIARASARGDGKQAALALGERVAPKGADLDLDESESTVDAQVSAKVPSPLSLFDFLPTPTVKATASAVKEG